LDEPVTRALVSDLDRLAEVLARQKPAWEPGTRHGYHAITLGFYQGEILRRIDPRHRTIGRFFHEEIAVPLDLDIYIRLPEWVPDDQLATMIAPTVMERLTGFPWRVALDTLNPHSKILRALHGSELPLDTSRVYARNLEIPSGGGVGTARALAHAYGAFATGGKELGLRQETLDLLAAPAIPPTEGVIDECLKNEVEFSLGFMKPKQGDLASPASFGHPGAGGAMGFADPQAGLGWGYVTCRSGTDLAGDPRDLALQEALYRALR
jgi:CubicO group peptidase (beta-lactamase class C family)